MWIQSPWYLGKGMCSPSALIIITIIIITTTTCMYTALYSLLYNKSSQQ